MNSGLLTFVSFFFLASNLLAQSRLDSIQHIPNVTVTASVKTDMIAPQQLQGPDLQMLTSHSVADAIRYFSGLQIKDYGGVGGVKTVNIRSMGSQHVGVFYDGIQLGNAQNGMVDLGKFSLDNMEMISVYNGQKAGVFQSAREFGSSGTIYMQTRRPRFEPDKKHNLQAVFRTGSFGLANPSFLWEQQLTPGISLSANTEFIYATGKYRFRETWYTPDNTVAWDTTGTRHNGDIRSLRAEVALFGASESGKWDLKGYFYDSDRGIPGAVVNNVWERKERISDRNAFVQGSFERRFSGDYRLRVNGKYAHDYTHYLRNDPRELYIDNTYRQQEAYLSVSQLYEPVDWWQLSLATDFHWNTLRADLEGFPFPTRYSQWVAMATWVRAGPLTVHGSLLATFIQEQVKGDKLAAAADNKQVWSPALFLNYQPFAGKPLTIRAFYKHAFRMPTFNDLYYVELGNTYLKPEFTKQYDLGFEYDFQVGESWFRSLRLQVDGYHNEVTDKIVAIPTGGQFRWMMLNLGHVKIDGIDAAVSTRMNWHELHLTTRLNYTWQRARDVTDPEEDYYGDQIPYIPRHSGSVVAGLGWKRWQLNYNFIYTGERYTSTANDPEHYMYPWYTNDLSLSYRFPLHKVGFEITGELNNLFDMAYDVVKNYPMPGRNYKFILRIML